MAETSDGTNSTRPYSRLQIALHWLVVCLILGQWYTSSAIQRTHNPFLPPSPSDLLQHALHNYAGLLVGLLMAIRIALAYFGRRRRAAIRSGIEGRLAAFAHGGLYLLIFSQVATGAIGSYLWAPARVLHGYVWDAVLILASLHVAAAIYHLVRGDEVFRRMLPRLR